MDEIRLPYKPNKTIFVMVVLFFGLCAAVLANVALANDRGLVLARVIELSPQNATIFYWALTGAAVLFVLLGIITLVKSITSNREIVITENTITLPKHNFSKIDVSVKLSDITNLTMQNIQGTKILNIEYLGGKISVSNRMLPNKQAFEGLVSQLQARTNS
jgi:hypothetical protein